MKKYTKLIALVLSVILGVSACCFNSFALNDKTVYDMGNGLTLTVSDEPAMVTRANSYTYFSDLSVGTTASTAATLVSNLSLSSNQSVFAVTFYSAPGTKLHFSIKDKTTGKYHGSPDSNGFLTAVSGNSTNYSFGGLTPGHEYSVRVYGDSSFTASGQIVAFDS